MIKKLLVSIPVILSALVPAAGAEGLDILIDHAVVEFDDSAVYIDEDGNVFVSVYDFSGYFGYEVNQNAENGTIEIVSSDKEIYLYPDDSKYTIDGETYELSVPVREESGIIYVECGELVAILNDEYLVQYDDGISTDDNATLNIFRGSTFTATADGVVDQNGNILSEEDLAALGLPQRYIDRFMQSVEEENAKAAETSDSSDNADKVLSVVTGSGRVGLVMDGHQVEFPDAEPFIDSNDRTMIPVRALSETLGYDVDWDEGTQTVTITGSDRTVTLVIGDTMLKCNGENIEMDTAAIISDERTYIPVRFVAEALGYTVEYGAQLIVRYTQNEDGVYVPIYADAFLNEEGLLSTE